ncbi:MAG: hypothetical protein LUF77_00125, partial [Oscillospiraceae bacterium]|nr:hypothetical protein [Oscillospiraceae bacterium]
RYAPGKYRTKGKPHNSIESGFHIPKNFGAKIYSQYSKRKIYVNLFSRPKRGRSCKKTARL